jgi:hypothetical protein
MESRALMISFLRRCLVGLGLAVVGIALLPTSCLAAQITEVLVHRENGGITRVRLEPSGTDVTPSYWMRFREDGSVCMVGSGYDEPTGHYIGHFSHFSDLADAVNSSGFLGLPNAYMAYGSIDVDADEITVSVLADGKTYSVSGPLDDAIEPAQLKKLLSFIDKIAYSINWTTTSSDCLDVKQ